MTLANTPNNNDSNGPSPAFYRSHSRAWHIREICCGIIKELTNLRNARDLADLNPQGSLYSRLEHLGGSLIGLGIRNGMHIDSDSFEENSPECMAEYVAGQLIKSTGYNFGLTSIVIPQASEWASATLDVTICGQPSRGYGVSREKLNEIVLSDTDLRTAINVGSRFLGLTEQELSR